MFLALLLAACARDAISPPATGHLTVTGRYEYIDGDRLIWRCRPNQECIDTLVRDDRLQREVEISPAMRVTLRVDRVSACGPQSSQVACIQSRDGTAFAIVQWLEVRRGQH